MKVRMSLSPFTVHRSQDSNPSPFTFPPSRAFTVVELAVVLVVIGLVVGGVLKTEQVYRNYKIRRLVMECQELRAACLVYKDKYGYLPGDDPYAVTHVGAAAGHIGDGNDNIDWWSSQLGIYVYEYTYAQEHLSKAGLIKGTYSGDLGAYKGVGNQPVPPILHVFGGRIVILGKNFEIDNLDQDVANAVDITMDDGIANKGSVRVYTDPNNAGKYKVYYIFYK